MKVTAGSTNVSVYYYIVQDASGTSPGEPKTGLLFSDIETGGSASYVRQGALRTDLTLITLASASAAHADGGFILVDDTNMPGLYRCDYPDAAFATGVDQIFCSIVVAAANNAVAAPILVDIDDNVDQSGDNFARLGSPAGASVSADIADMPTVAEFNARTIAAADYFDPTADTVANVTLVATTTANSDMRGTNSALLASSAPTNFGDMSITVTTGLLDITQSAADKAWSTTARILTAATNITSDGSSITMSASGVIGTVNLVNTTTTNTDMRGTESSFLAASAPANFSALGISVGGSIDDVALVATTTANTDMRGTNSAATATALATAQLDLDTITGSDGATLATAQALYAPSKAGDAMALTTAERAKLTPAKNAALADIPFLMRDSSNNLLTGLTVTVTKSLDGASFSATTGTVSEIGFGAYSFDASAADMNGTWVTFKFTEASADDAFASFRTSG